MVEQPQVRRFSPMFMERLRVFEDHPTIIHGEAQKSMIQSITPSYKSVTERQTQKIDFGSDLNLPEAVGDYKVKETQDHFKLQIIDPKVTSNASMPTYHREIPRIQRRNLDFPSEHSKRSFLKLEPMQQRKLRAIETRPITTSAYLTESLDRHREMEASRLKDYLKARENDANKPWDKPQWPGPKTTRQNDQTLKELAEIKKTIETLQKVRILLFQLFLDNLS
ncbi:Protein pat-12 [Dirofilaria immitis]